MVKLGLVIVLVFIYSPHSNKTYPAHPDRDVPETVAFFCSGETMDLKVEWISATRVGEEKAAVEQAYRNRLLDLFGSVAAAAEAKGHYHRNYEPPVHHWTTYNKIAFIEATTQLTPSERQLAHFVVKFEKHN